MIPSLTGKLDLLSKMHLHEFSYFSQIQYKKGTDLLRLRDLVVALTFHVLWVTIR